MICYACVNDFGVEGCIDGSLVNDSIVCSLVNGLIVFLDVPYCDSFDREIGFSGVHASNQRVFYGVAQHSIFYLRWIVVLH